MKEYKSKIFMVLVVAFSLTACSKTPPKCGDENTITTLKKIISSQIDGLDKIDPSVVNSAFVISMPRAESYDENIKKYSCLATVVSGDAYEVPVSFSTQIDDKGQPLVFVSGISEAGLFAIKLGLIKASEQFENKKPADSSGNSGVGAQSIENINPDGIPSFNSGEPYAAVREKLIGSGWNPFHAEGADVCQEGDARCENRPEMDSCAGGGMANCRFLWEKSQKIIGICTVGEAPVFSNFCSD